MGKRPKLTGGGEAANAHLETISGNELLNTYLPHGRLLVPPFKCDSIRARAGMAKVCCPGGNAVTSLVRINSAATGRPKLWAPPSRGRGILKTSPQESQRISAPLKFL